MNPTHWHVRGVTAIVVLACAVCFSANLPDPDFWGHVQYGWDLLRDGLPATATYTYTAVHHRWINHENLAELAFATGVNVLGTSGLLIVKCLLGVGLVSLVLLRASRRGVAGIPLWLTALLVAANEMFFWNMRPQLFSLVYFTLLLELLEFCFADWQPSVIPPRSRLHGLWLAVPLFILWSNTHGGVLAGMTILGAYLVGRSLELLWRHGRTAGPTVIHFALVTLLALSTIVLNPYGLELPQWLLSSVFNPRPEIGEWNPPELLESAWLPFWVTLALTLAAAIGTREKRDVTQFVLLGLVVWQCLEHRRHIAFFAILFGYWMPAHVASLWAWAAAWTRARGRQTTSKPAAQPVETPSVRGWLAPTVMLIPATLVLGLLSTVLVQQLRDMPVRRDLYPVSAFQFVADERLEGKAVVAFGWAQYALAAFGDRLPLAFDGRYDTCYPLTVVDMYFDYEHGPHGPKGRWRSPTSPPFHETRILEFGQPDLILVERDRERTARIVAAQGDRFALLYQDQIAQLWGRRSRFDDRSSPHFLPPARRRISDAPQVGHVSWPGLPQHR